MDTNNQIDFLTIYRRIVIKNTILYHLKMLNINYHKRIIIRSLGDYQYKDYLRSVVLYYGSDSIVLNNLINSLPPSVKIIQLGGNLVGSDHFISKIPSNITTLKLEDNQIELIEIPNTLTSLNMGNHFQSIPKIRNGESFFPSNGLVYLNLGNQFNDALLKGCLPSTLKTLKLGNSFEKTMNELYLPDSITDLDFGDKFSDKFIGIYNLPKGLLKLRLGSGYQTQFTPDTLPKSLTKLVLTDNYNGPFNASVIPSSITSLKFNYYPFVSKGPMQNKNTKVYERPCLKLNLQFLVGLKSLQVGSRQMVTLAPNQNLKKFTTFFNSKLVFLKEPDSIQNYRLIPIPKRNTNGSYGYQPYYGYDAFHIGKISSTVNSLYLPQCSNYNDFPTSIKHLSVNVHSNILNNLPSQIISFKEFYLGSDSERDFENLKSLKALSTYYCYDKIKLPNNGNLEILELRFIFNQEFEIDKIPSSVHTLIIKGNTSIKLPLPSNIKSIYISSTNSYFLNKICFKNVPDLLEIIKVIEDSNNIFEKLIQSI